MTSPLIDRLVGEFGYPVVDEASIDDFLRRHEQSVLFFTEDPRAFPESNDVAVILPELMRVFGRRLTPALVHRGCDQKLKKRYGFTAWPALVFLRGERYLGAITRVQSWDDYMTAIERILDSEPQTPPQPTIPVAAAGRGDGCR